MFNVFSLCTLFDGERAYSYALSRPYSSLIFSLLYFTLKQEHWYVVSNITEVAYFRWVIWSYVFKCIDYICPYYIYAYDSCLCYIGYVRISKTLDTRIIQKNINPTSIHYSLMIHSSASISLKTFKIGPIIQKSFKIGSIIWKLFKKSVTLNGNFFKNRLDYREIPCTLSINKIEYRRKAPIAS